MAILQALYVSTARLPAGEEPAALAAILDTAHVRNAAADLTGCLGYCGGRFVQILEGPGAALDAVLARISSDPRHADMVVRLRREVRNRSFPDWRMAHVELAMTAPEMIGVDFATTPPALLISMLLRVAETACPQPSTASDTPKPFASATGRR